MKQRKRLIKELEKQDYSVVVETAIERLRAGLHLELSEPRRAFVYAICNDEYPATRERLEACIIGMVLAFIDLYKECMKGKRYAKLQQEWMVILNNYFTSVESDDAEQVGSSAAAATSPVCSTDRQEQCKLWHIITEAASKAGYTVNIQDERLVVSTLCSVVSTKVNDDTRQEYGHQVFKLAKQELESDGKVHPLFEKCTVTTRP